jgi:ATP-dependent DNA helicase RecG
LLEHDVLKKLFLPLTNLKDLGEKTAISLRRLNLELIIDLLFFLPYNFNQYQYLPNLSQVKDGSLIITKVVVHEVFIPKNLRGGKNLTKIFCSNNTGCLNLTYFNYYPSYLLGKISAGSEIIVKGKIERYFGQLVISHPEIINANQTFVPIEPQYHLTYGILNKQLMNFVKAALLYLPNFYEWLPEKYVLKHKFMSFNQALKLAHNPLQSQDISPDSACRRRLAFDELLAHQLAVKLVRKNHKQLRRAQNLVFSGALSDKLLKNLNFELTGGQKTALAEITQDQQSAHHMLRLVQGDVGSGKTIVALIAMLNVIESSKQAALMAPTDLLATQHYRWILSVTANLNIKVALLTGKIKGNLRKEIFTNLQEGTIDLIIGTHALFEENVVFKDLALIVIDEQHRFGVAQRFSLANKNKNSDLLLMSATPIPRTLTMVLYGDMCLSQIKEKPLNRLPIITSVISIKKEQELITSMQKIIAKGQQIYWICPLIEENEKLPLKDAISRHNELRAQFGDVVGLIHGKMKAEEKNQIMEDFAANHIKILVATTVIEVGIDVKNASLIIIEHAQRFGLAQLHQLRGRVGRSNIASYCILLYHYPISDEAKMRLNIMKNTDDGFIIAQEDLKLRGSGDLLGTKQSGSKDFKFADLNFHEDLLNSAYELSEEVIATDRDELSEYKSLKILLYLFGYHQFLKYLKS